jgi:hypothetical protein
MAAAAAAAAAKRKADQQEEEEMTNYSSQELDEGWEFKIVRSSTSAFKKPETFRKLINEEARAGWTLVEKFDNSRVRFKRLISARQRDAALGSEIDPYRIEYGISENMLALWIVFGILAAFGIFVAVMLILNP